MYEQLSNGTVFAHPLPLPSARDFSAADFDGDGDVDILIMPPNSDSCLYFERLGDGSLEQLSGTDNPFNGVCKEKNKATGTNEIFASLGDWDGDGEKDLIVVDDFKVTLWTNRPLETFVEVNEKDNPFGQLRLHTPSEVSLVDANDDGRLDVVVPPQSSALAWWRGYETYSFYEHGANGLLVEQLGRANPFDKVTYNKTNNKFTFRFAKNQIVDLDGDGDLDIVHRDLQYTRNDGGHFTYLNLFDPDHPFRGVQDNLFSCWAFVDWDGDKDLDLVQAYMHGGGTSEEIAEYVRWRVGIFVEMARNGTSKVEREAWEKRNPFRQMRFYRNVGGSFQELTGSENPFHDIALDGDSACPTFVDLDKDDVLELVLGTTDGNLSLSSHPSIFFFSIVFTVTSPVFLKFLGFLRVKRQTTQGKLQYFKQQNRTFQRVEETPFADLLVKGTFQGMFGILPRFVDWDGDGNMDLVITGTDKVQLFQRGICQPSSSYCKSGVCNQRTSACTCDSFAEGHDCSLCGSFHVRHKGKCRPCPGHNELAGTCSRRGEGGLRRQFCD